MPGGSQSSAGSGASTIRRDPLFFIDRNGVIGKRPMRTFPNHSTLTQELFVDRFLVSERGIGEVDSRQVAASARPR